VVDVSLTLFIKVINPNVTPIQFSSTVMDIYYKGTLLGQAQVRLSCLLALSFRVETL
jgi:LEA14-like dessication related protein